MLMLLALIGCMAPRINGVTSLLSKGSSVSSVVLWVPPGVNGVTSLLTDSSCVLSRDVGVVVRKSRWSVLGSVTVGHTTSGVVSNTGATNTRATARGRCIMMLPLLLRMPSWVKGVTSLLTDRSSVLSRDVRVVVRESGPSVRRRRRRAVERVQFVDDPPKARFLLLGSGVGTVVSSGGGGVVLVMVGIGSFHDRVSALTMDIRLLLVVLVQIGMMGLLGGGVSLCPIARIHD